MEARNILFKAEISFDYLEMHQIKNTLDDRFLVEHFFPFYGSFVASLEGTLDELLLLLLLCITATDH